MFRSWTRLGRLYGEVGAFFQEWLKPSGSLTHRKGLAMRGAVGGSCYAVGCDLGSPAGPDHPPHLFTRPTITALSCPHLLDLLTVRLASISANIGQQAQLSMPIFTWQREEKHNAGRLALCRWRQIERRAAIPLGLPRLTVTVGARLRGVRPAGYHFAGRTKLVRRQGRYGARVRS